MTADQLTAERIGLDWLREALAPVGAFGRHVDDATPPYVPGDEARALAEIVGAHALAVQLSRDGVDRLRAALRAVPEPGPILSRARAGDPLDDVDFYELGRFVDALGVLARAWDAAGGTAERRPPTLDELSVLLAPGRDGGAFYLADAFGPGLAPARSALAAAEAAYEAQREAIAARVRETLGVDPTGEEFVVLRDQYDGPLPSDVLLVRETPTYRVAAIRVLAPERDAALARLAEEEDGARRALAQRVADLASAVAAATRTLGALDRALARVAFGQRWGGCVPQFAGDRLAFEDATFAPLADVLAQRARRYTPVSLDLRGAAVLTGPNMGGKSAALATAGFLCACVALGAPPPARAATLPLLERIVWIGGEPTVRARLLSAYAAEVVRAHELLAVASPAALALVDEFARTTGPREGRALLVAFVEALRERGAFALVATHFDGVARASRAQHLRIAGLGAALPATAATLDEALDAINVAMDYRVVPAADGETVSDALALARLLGFDETVLARARTLYGQTKEDHG